MLTQRKSRTLIRVQFLRADGGDLPHRHGPVQPGRGEAFLAQCGTHSRLDAFILGAVSEENRGANGGAQSFRRADELCGPRHLPHRTRQCGQPFHAFSHIDSVVFRQV